MPLRARQGFTLVELLVVIAVIGILAAIFMPIVQSARASSKRVACLSNLQQLAKAVQMYVNDHQGQYFTCASRPTLEPGMASFKPKKSSCKSLSRRRRWQRRFGKSSMKRIRLACLEINPPGFRKPRIQRARKLDPLPREAQGHFRVMRGLV